MIGGLNPSQYEFEMYHRPGVRTHAAGFLFRFYMQRWTSNDVEDQVYIVWSQDFFKKLEENMQ